MTDIDSQELRRRITRHLNGCDKAYYAARNAGDLEAMARHVARKQAVLDVLADVRAMEKDAER